MAVKSALQKITERTSQTEEKHKPNHKPQERKDHTRIVKKERKARGYKRHYKIK